MNGSFSWVNVALLGVSVISLAVTILIFRLGRRLSFGQQRDRIRTLEARAWQVLKPMRDGTVDNGVIVMNVDRYEHGYDGSNSMTLGGYVYTKAEFIEIVHDGVEVILRGVECYLGPHGERTLTPSSRQAATVVEVGHIPWAWIEDIDPAGNEFDGSPIFYVRHRAAGRSPYDRYTFREGRPVPFGPTQREYFPPIRELGVHRPRPVVDRVRFFRDLRRAKAMETAARRAGFRP